jgi:hypothetical protein
VLRRLQPCAFVFGQVSVSVGTTVVSTIFAAVQASLAFVSIYTNAAGAGCATCSNDTLSRTYCTQWTSMLCVDETGFVAALFAEASLAAVALFELIVAFATNFINCGCGDYAFGKQRV